MTEKPSAVNTMNEYGDLWFIKTIFISFKTLFLTHTEQIFVRFVVYYLCYQMHQILLAEILRHSTFKE